jgi:hypothetical protein
MPSTRRRPSRHKRWPTSLATLAAVVAALALAAGAIAFLSLFTELPNGAPLLALVVVGVPLLVFLLTSDRVAELHAPGGWRMVFRRAAGQLDTELDLTPVHAVQVSQSHPAKDPSHPPSVQVVEDPSHPPNSVQVVEDPSHPPNSVQVDLGNFDATTPLCEYLKWARSRGEAVKWLMITADDKLRSFLPLSSIRLDPELSPLDNKTLETTCDANQLIEWLEQKNQQRLERLVGYVDARHAARADWTRSKLLEDMFKKRLGALPVVDTNGEILGVAERDRMIEALLVELASYA